MSAPGSTDPPDSTAPPSHEPARLAALRRYRILDTPPEEAFDRLTELAAQWLEAPVAGIAFIDERRQWLKSAVGLDRREMAREHAVCTCHLGTDGVVTVEDLAADPRFDKSPWATSAGLCFYAGAPLVSPGGHVLGALFVMDTAPRTLSAPERSTLEKLAATAVDELRLRHAESERERASEALAEERNRLGQLTHHIPGLLFQFVAGPDGTREFRFVSPQAETLLGLDPDEDNLFERALRRIPPSYREQVHASNEAAIAAGEPWSGEFPIETDSGEMRWLKGLSRPQKRGDELIYHGVFLDITQRKRAEAALRRSEELHRTTLAHMTDAVFITDENGTFTYVCPNVDHIFGHGPEAVRELGTITDLLGADPAAGHDFETEGPITNAELCICDAAGAAHDLLVNVQSVPIQGGTRMYTCRDITERKEAERALRRERDVLERIFEASPAAIAMLDETGRFTFASARAQEVLGLTPSAMQERRYNDPEWKITTADGHPIPDEELPFARVMDTGAPVQDIEHAIEWPDGTRRLLSVSGAPLKDEAGDMAGAVFVMEDITDERAAERQQRLHAEALEAAANAIAITDAEGVMTWVNPAFETLTGYSQEEAAGQTLKLLRSGQQDEAFYEELWDTVTTGRVWRGELVNRRKDGTLYVEEQTITPVTDEDGTPHHFIAVKRDVTDQKRREQELIAAKETAEAAQARAEAAQAEAEEMNRLKSALLANMSHEIRTPLTSIIGFSEVLRDMDLEAPADQFASMIHRGGERLLTTLNSVLDLSQLEAGAMQLHPEEVAVGPLVRDVAAGFELRARDAGVDLRVEIDDRDTTAHLDPGAVERIASNLISNAIKFTGEGRATGGSVTVTLDAAPETLTLTVDDTGVGIDEAFLPHLFDAFKQESTGDARDFEGSGLGLAITKELTDLMGGTITVESAKGEGTTFTVELPRNRNSATPNRPEESG